MKYCKVLLFNATVPTGQVRCGRPAEYVLLRQSLTDVPCCLKHLSDAISGALATEIEVIVRKAVAR